MSGTINVGELNTYLVHKTVGGYVVVYLQENGDIRNVDGAKLYKHRQNAYRRCKQLNDALKKTDEMIARDGAIIL